MNRDKLRQILAAYRRMSPPEWGLRCTRGVLSGFPVVGGLLSEAISPAVEGAAEASPNSLVPSHDIVVAACTFDPEDYSITGCGLSSVTDCGVGDYIFSLVQSCKDYVVNAQVADASFDIVEQESHGFRIKVWDRSNPKQAVDRQIKFLVLDASS